MLKIKHKGLKIILLIIIILIIILFGGLFYVNHNINSIITERVNSNFEESEYSNYYNLEFSNLRINILTGTIKFTDVILTPKENVDTMFFYKNGKINFKTKSFALKGANILKFIKTDTLFVKNIYVTNPEINFIKYKDKEDIKNIDTLIKSPYIIVKKATIKNGYFTSVDLINKKENVFNDINITIDNISYSIRNFVRNFSFENAEINIKNFKQKHKSHNLLSLENAKIKLDSCNVFLEPDTVKYYYKNIEILMDRMYFNNHQSVSSISTDSIAINYAKKTLSVNTIRIKPNISKKEFYKRFKYQREYLDMELKEIKIFELNFDSLINSRAILANKITINKGNINAYVDKTLSVDNKARLFPSEQILQIPIRTNINKIDAKNINIISQEKLGKNNLGQVDAELNIILKNITNCSRNKALIIKGEGSIHNTANFNIILKFDYKTPGFAYNGYIKAFDITKLNSVITSFTSVKAKSGKIKSIKFSGYANLKNSKGEMTFLYNNLKLQVINKEKTRTDKYKNKALSLTANSIIMSNNPVKKKPVRTVNFVLERDKTTGFIGYLWKSFFEGISKTLLPEKDQINKTKHKFKRKK